MTQNSPDDAARPMPDRLRMTLTSMLFIVGLLIVMGVLLYMRYPSVAAVIAAVAACATVIVHWRALERNRKLQVSLEEQGRAQAGERNLLRGLIDALPDNIFIKDVEGRYIIDNIAHTRFLGSASPKDVVGRTVFDFFPRTIAQHFQDDDDTVLRTGQSLIAREEQITKHGEPAWVSTTKVPLRDAQGVTTGLVCITRDITDRKRAEDQLLEKNRQLEEAVKSEQKAHAALKDAQVRMIQSEKLVALGRLVAGVAHEINNPLAFVMNNLAVLQRDAASVIQLLEIYQAAQATGNACDPDRMRQAAELAERIDLPYTVTSIPEMLTRSRDGLKRIQEIVRDLRDFSRQETVGTAQPESDLNPGVQSTVNIARARAAKQKVELVMDLEPLPQVHCVPSRINQVILNLVVNAIDACPDGGTVTVRTRPSGDGVELSVTDTGTGIEPAVLETMFDPFFTTKPQGQGTGLGLSLSHGIVADHGGRIEVTSELGKGSTFKVTLPQKPPPGAATGGR